MAKSINFIMDHQGNDHAAGLSANAAVFIPRNYGPPIGTAPIQTIPTYMTNCFPFVQPDFNGNRLGGNHGNWSRHQRPNRFGNRNNSGHHGNRFPTPNKFSEPPLFPFTSPPPPQDPYYNQYMPPPNKYLINNMTSLPVMPSEGENDINSNSYSSNSRCRRNQRDKNSNNNNNNNVWRSNESIGTDDSGRKTESSNRQRRRTNSGKKGGAKNDSPRAPVLVLYEREIQTDFSENFAYKTLEEHPSSLYRKSHRRNIHDNRDLNSDSGYSSPLHKRNQITIGTQSDSALSMKITSNSIKSDDPSIVHAATVPQQKFSYAFIAQKEPSPRPVINQDNQNSAENLKIGQQKSSNNQNRNKPNPGNRSHDSQLANRNTSNPGNRSHDSQLANRNTSNTYDLNNQHINKQANKISEVRNKFQGDIQTKQNQGRKTGKINSDEETRGFSRKGTTSIDENDYGFSRTKNLRSERKQSHESNFNKNNLQEGNKSETGQNLETEGESGTQGKKKRRRRRKRKKKNPDDPADSQDEAEYEPQQEVELHFEDVEEFPDLSSAKALNNKSSGVGISYSAILQTVPVSRPSLVETNKTSSSEDSPRKDNSSLEDKGTRASRRRRKRKDILNTAAENELAEIGLEQQMLKEQCLKTTGQKSNKEEKGQTPGILKVNPKTQNSGKKSKQNVSLDLGAVIDALEQKKTTISLTSAARIEQKVKTEQPKKKEVQKSKGGHNVLDASAPIKRGKERETPKAKKPSPLKKVILKEREEKKHLKMLEGTESGSTEAAVGIGVVSAESDLSQDAMSTKSSIDYTGTPGSANLSPVSQTSPISMSPLSPGTSPLSSEVNSPIAGAVGKDVVKKIHSRRFREYCNQVLDKDIDECATTLLQDLVRFQDRMYHKDPSKAKLKRRLVLGLREVAKHLKLRKIKCVIISPNLEKIQSKGGLDDALNNILTLCNEQNVPFVFALGRRALGRACAKMVPVSVVGIFNFSGSEENFKQLIDLTAKARESYGEMVAAIEIEIKEYPMKKQQATTPHVFAHMGHSRTPSGASVLSFTSSILSEPISENYPHSEPETDSKGYEIVKDDALIKQGLPTDSSGYQTQMRIIHSNTKDDDGNEADNEEEGDRINRDENQDALPHIDSIHTSGAHDLNTEILSQHSGRTLENCEAMSTHSSRTLGDGSSTILADFGDRSKHGTPKSTESPSNTLQRGKVVDEERIQHWVDETSSRLENLALEEESYEDSTDEMTDSDESEEKYNFEMHNDDSKKRIIDCSAGESENKSNEVLENCKKLCDSKTDMEKVSEKLLKIASDSCDGEHVNALPNSCDIVNSSDNSMVEIDSKNCSEKSDIEDSNPLSENCNMADCKMRTDKASSDMTDISTCDAIQSSDQQNVIAHSDTTKDLTRDTNLDKNTTAPTNVEIHFD